MSNRDWSALEDACKELPREGGILYEDWVDRVRKALNVFEPARKREPDALLTWMHVDAIHAKSCWVIDVVPEAYVTKFYSRLVRADRKVVDNFKLTHVALTPHGLEPGGYVTNQERKVPRMPTENVAKVIELKNEDDIEHAIEMIVALTRNLLALAPNDVVDVHVKPEKQRFTVHVEVQGFVLTRQDRRLSAALTGMLSDLADRVHRRAVEAAALLDTVNRGEDKP